jgi:hypothetical protein
MRTYRLSTGICIRFIVLAVGPNVNEEHHSHAVWCCPRIELQVMQANGICLGSTGNRIVDAGELTAVILALRPDGWWLISTFLRWRDNR